jgi:hypothetical protein
MGSGLSNVHSVFVPVSSPTLIVQSTGRWSVGNVARGWLGVMRRVVV